MYYDLRFKYVFVTDKLFSLNTNSNDEMNSRKFKRIYHNYMFISTYILEQHSAGKTQFLI